jgi:hypothetical protein
MSKKLNNYVLAIDQELYEKTPKAVWAAIAISYASGGGDRFEEAAPNIAREWQALQAAGIVPQSAPIVIPKSDGTKVVRFSRRSI